MLKEFCDLCGAEIGLLGEGERVTVSMGIGYDKDCYMLCEKCAKSLKEFLRKEKTVKEK